jgi:hypothetical protein
MGIGALVTWDDDAVMDMIIRVGRAPIWWQTTRWDTAAAQVRIGVPDPSLTGVSGIAAVTELCEQLGVVGAVDVAVGPIKQRAVGYSAG